MLLSSDVRAAFEISSSARPDKCQVPFISHCTFSFLSVPVPGPVTIFACRKTIRSACHRGINVAGVLLHDVGKSPANVMASKQLCLKPEVPNEK